MTRRVRFYIGYDLKPRFLDPYWNFDHINGEPFVYGDLRLYLISIGGQRMERYKHSKTGRCVFVNENHPVGDILYECTGRRDNPVKYSDWRKHRTEIEITNQERLFGVDVTKLYPGKFSLHVDYVDNKGTLVTSDKFETIIKRAPIYTYIDEPDGTDGRYYRGIRWWPPVRISALKSTVSEIKNISQKAGLGALFDRIFGPASPIVQPSLDTLSRELGHYHNRHQFMQKIERVLLTNQYFGTMSEEDYEYYNCTERILIDDHLTAESLRRQDAREPESGSLEQFLVAHSWDLVLYEYAGPTSTDYIKKAIIPIVALTTGHMDGDDFKQNKTRWIVPSALNKKVINANSDTMARDLFDHIGFSNWFAPYEYEYMPKMGSHNKTLNKLEFTDKTIYPLREGPGLLFPDLPGLSYQPDVFGNPGERRGIPIRIP